VNNYAGKESNLRGRNIVMNYSIGIPMAKTVIHISEVEAANNFSGLMAKVRAGNEVIIEHDAHPVAIVSPVKWRPRLLSQAIALAEAKGSTATLDEEFSRDLESIVKSHGEPLSLPPWE